jgi:hypothetical protein
MPRQRKASRAYRSPNYTAEQRVRERCKSPWLKVVLQSDTFYKEFPTKEERDAFRAIRPGWSLELFGFTELSSDLWPASSRFGYPFRRSLDFYDTATVASSFDAPDLRTVPYRDRQGVLAHARGLWWRANRLEMTADEMRWMLKRGTDAA